MPAKLPSERITPPENRLRDLQIGGEGFVLFLDMEVDTDGFCHLNPDAKLTKRSTISSIGVRRDAAGYHVSTLRHGGAKTFRWKLTPWDAERFLNAGYFPVETFTDEQLDV